MEVEQQKKTKHLAFSSVCVCARACVCTVFPYLQRAIYFQVSLKAKPPLKLFIVLFFFEAAQLSCSKTPVPSRKTENAETLENAEEFHSYVLFPQQRQYLSGVRIKTGPFGECQQDSTRQFKPQ